VQSTALVQPCWHRDVLFADWRAGKQAEVLNIVMEDLLEGHPISEKKMKEVLGHTPLQVCQLCYRPADVLMHYILTACTCQVFH
jgi:acid phosphatase family membrane protein YuiD